MDRGAGQPAVHSTAKSWTQLRNQHVHFHFFKLQILNGTHDSQSDEGRRRTSPGSQVTRKTKARQDITYGV